jgi:WD40 repeat protein
VSAFKWKDYEVPTTKESGKWWKMKSKTTASRKRCWEKSGELKGSRDWALCLASDARGSYAVAGCRGGDLKLWRPPKAERSGINRWVEAGVAERSHDSSRMRSDVRAVAVDDASDTLVSGGTDWCVRLWDARTLRSKGALGDINRADNPDADENYDDDQRGHNYPVTTVDIRNHMIVSGGEDKRVMLWDCRATEGAVACLNRMAPVTVVKFVGKEHELLVAGEYGIAEIIDLRTHQSVTTLMKPEEWDAKTKENEGVWEGQLKNQHPILDACVSPTGDRVSILAWRPAGGVVEVFDAESWSLVSQVNLATELPRISPSSLAACRLPAGGC